MTSSGFIGVFDSGVGGISVLKHLTAELPYENFVFYGDSAHAPYGTKTPEQINQRSYEIAHGLIQEGAKALVIACNTATAAAAQTLRKTYPKLPIVGVEPALKPAALAHPHGRIIVMATAGTLSLPKFHTLEVTWGATSEVIPIAGAGIVELIEADKADSPEMYDLLENLIGRYAGSTDAVVLGCTHYPFITRQIRVVLGDVDFYDGGAGAAHQLHRLLKRGGLLARAPVAASAVADSVGNASAVHPIADNASTHVEFRSSIPGAEELKLYQKLFSTPIETC